MLETFEKMGCIESPPEVYVELLKTLSKISPVCATFPSQRLKALQSLIDNGKASTSCLAELQNHISVLFRLLSEIQDISKHMKCLLAAVIEIVTATFSSCTISEVPVTAGNEQSVAFFPNLPVVRGRGNYAADKKKTKNGCTKKEGRHPVLLPGIFTVFCSHGICYGFEIMECAESPNRPFTFLKTRFAKPPAVVIYDNACNLHQYCLNREPIFFQNTLMVVDGLHWDNHAGCSVGYKGLDYPLLRGINTQIVEQNNSKLRKLKSSLSCMSFEHFMENLKLFLWHGNVTTKIA